MSLAGELFHWFENGFAINIKEHTLGKLASLEEVAILLKDYISALLFPPKKEEQNLVTNLPVVLQK